MANKLISQLGLSDSNLQDSDHIEGQKLGMLITKRFTGAMMRAVEKGEREAQDDVIEASVGLSVAGAYVPEEDSWHIRTVDFNAGCTDRGGATGALTPTVQNALRLLDAKITAAGAGALVVLRAGLSADTTLTDIIPAACLLQYIVLVEKSGNEAILDLGTTVGGDEVFLNVTVPASGVETVNKGLVYSMTAATTLYLNDDSAVSNWNGATVDVYFVMQPLIPGGSSTGITIVGYYEGAYGFSIPPTKAQLVVVLGNATDFAAGSVFIINDTTSDIYFIMTNGVNWYINSAIFDLAL